jgi:hypothetical protein
MGWEVRRGRRYLYRNRRANGRPVKEYVAADGPAGELLARVHDAERAESAERRALQRRERDAARERAAELLALGAGADVMVRAAVGGLLAAVGFHRHKRGEWRMRRELKEMQDLTERTRALTDKVRDLRAAREAAPLVRYDAPAGDAEAVALFAAARAGDVGARERVVELVKARGWVNWLGDLGQQATRQLVHRAAGGDPVLAVGLTEKAVALRAQLLGDAPSVLEDLLVRRVVNGWLTVHLLELELTVRAPADLKAREHLDKALTRAQKRFAEAARELARVRALGAPARVTQLMLAEPVAALPSAQ